MTKAKGTPKGRPPQNKHEMAQMLVESAMLGDTAAAAKYGISLRSLRRYRKDLQTDPLFASLFEQASAQVMTRPWAEMLDDALQRTIKKMAYMVECQSSFSSESLTAVTGAFRAFSEMQLAREVLTVDSSDSDQARAPQETAEATQQTRYN